MIVQQNYTTYFHIGDSFLRTSCTSVWKRARNSKENINIQGLFVLTVDYADMTTCPLTKYYYIIERVYFIYRLFLSRNYYKSMFILYITTFSFLMFLYTV